ncbi:hypothetical protein Tco_0537495 [Tanacetum coccineum]
MKIMVEVYTGEEYLEPTDASVVVAMIMRITSFYDEQAAVVEEEEEDDEWEAEETGPWQKESRLTLPLFHKRYVLPTRELAIEDNQMKPGNGHWENEYQHQYNAGPSSWTISFRGPANERVHHGPFNDQWFDEISKLHVNDWAAEFGRQVGEGILGDDSADNWANTYDD